MAYPAVQWKKKKRVRYIHILSQLNVEQHYNKLQIHFIKWFINISTMIIIFFSIPYVVITFVYVFITRRSLDISMQN